MCYSTGNGCKKDLKKAVSWYLKAASQGLKEAQLSMGIIYNQSLFNQKIDKQKAHDFFLASAQQGYGLAQIELAKLLMQSPERETQDSGSAIHWLRQAEKHNTMESMLLQAEYYLSHIDKDDSDNDHITQALFCLETARVFKQDHDVGSSLVDCYFELMTQADVLSQTQQKMSSKPDVEQEEINQQDVCDQSNTLDQNNPQVGILYQQLKQLTEDVLKPSDKLESSLNHASVVQEENNITDSSDFQVLSSTSSQTEMQEPDLNKAAHESSFKANKSRRVFDAKDNQERLQKRQDQLTKMAKLRAEKDKQVQVLRQRQLSAESLAIVTQIRSADKYKEVTFPQIRALFADPWFETHGILVHVRNKGKNIDNKMIISLTNSNTKLYRSVGTHFMHGKKLERKELDPNFIKDISDMLKEIAGL